MKTQLGSGSGFVHGTVSVGNAAKSSNQTAEAVQPVASPGATGDQNRSPESKDKPAKPKHPALENNARLTIEKDHETGKYVYKSVNRDTGEVINQWPREKMLKAIAAYKNTSGLIIDQKV
ncbi:MAG: flagellar protein FlaG [Robiginitomaculum sp.]|nr:flagellar protein FlaG [Robiginitomaculum sp.]